MDTRSGLIGKSIQFTALILLPLSLGFVHYFPSETKSIGIFTGAVILFALGTWVRAKGW